MAQVNKRGLEEIRQFLIENHKDGPVFETAPGVAERMLMAWAEDAEYQMGIGNPPEIELKSYDSVHHRTQTFRLSDEGVDMDAD